MQIAILCPLEVRADSGGVLEVTGTRLRRLLIVLAMHPRHVVPTSRIVDAVWANDPPAEPPNAVQALVSRLRRAIRGIDLTNQANGYRLDLADDAIDMRRFERLAGQGRSELDTSPAQAAETLRAALSLWRGTAVVDADGADFADATRGRLEELRLGALRDRIDADLPRGQIDPLVSELEGLVAGAPMREPFVVLLMRALDAIGERGRALMTFDQARSSLAGLVGWRGDFEAAATVLDEALECVVELGAWEDRMSFRTQLARMLWLAGDSERARFEIAQAVRDAARVGSGEAQGIAAVAAGDMARLDGDLATARVYLARAFDVNADLSVAPQFRALATTAAAGVEGAAGNLDAARRLHHEALVIAATSHDAPVIAQVLVGLADSAALDGDAPARRSCWVRAR